MTHFMSNLPDINYDKQFKFVADIITFQTITNARFMLLKYQGGIVVTPLNVCFEIKQHRN